MELITRNVNTAFRDLVSGIHEGRYDTVASPSRYGPIVRFQCPVTVSYSHPNERLLFNSARNVNPFSLMYESLWTLAGRSDVAPISYYTKRMQEFSDDGVTWYGAYGYRWRHHADGDQLDRVVSLMKDDHTTRRVVLVMWDAGKDLHGQAKNGKDYPCNTHCYPTVRGGRLNLTVCNRSNDLVYGMLGANYVTFSFLQEYLASRIGVGVGTYHHFTNDLHVYTGADWKSEEWLSDGQPDYYTDLNASAAPLLVKVDLWGRSLKTIPLVRDPETFERELPAFVEWAWEYNQFKGPDSGETALWGEPFLNSVADPMVRAYRAHKNKGATALSHAQRIAADDWRIACTAWFERRLK